MADAPSKLLETVKASNDVTWLKGCLEHNRKIGNDAVAAAVTARMRDIELRNALNVKGGDGTLEGRVLESLRVYREILRHKHGKKLAAGYTERAIRNHGPKGALIVSLQSKKPTEGLLRLAEYDRLDCSYEQIAIDFANELPPEIVEQAKRNLAALDTDRTESVDDG